MNKKTVMTWMAAATLATASTGAFAHDRGQAALIGGVVGAFAGAVVGQQVSGQNGVLPGVLIGAAAGAAIGSSGGHDEYQRSVGYRPDYRPDYRQNYRPQPVRYVPVPAYRGGDDRYGRDDRGWRGGDIRRGNGYRYRDQPPARRWTARDEHRDDGRGGGHWDGRR